MEKDKEDLINQREEMIKELIQGIEVANKLHDQFVMSTDNNIISTDNQLRDDFAKSSLSNSYFSEIYENQKVLINNILTSFDKTITMAKLMMVQAQETSRSVLESPPSQNSNLFSKKRKRNRKEVKRVNVACSALGSEGTLGDGYSWRKYGQKIILGAKFPRGYYRCTHRHTKGCEATKQVQQLHEEPTIYELIYSGEHTCSLWAHMFKAQTKHNPAQIIELKPEPTQTRPDPQQEIFLGLGPNGELKVEEVDYQNEAHFLRSFSFSSNLIETGPFHDTLNYSALGFGSPNITECDYFPMSPTRVIGDSRGLNVQFSDSELIDAMSGPNSVTNSPKVGEYEFPLDPLLDIDYDFSFEF